MQEYTFEKAYPNITQWIESQGWVEIGEDETSDSLVRCLDPGGMVWESGDEYTIIDEALAALEEALETLIEEFTG
jgi:hypothetical protein